MTFYTAVGNLEQVTGGVNKHHPTVKAGGEKLIVDIPEAVIWTLLSGRIMDMPNLEKMYTSRVEALGIENMPGCGAYIDRLLQRGIVVQGTGETGHDALFDLLRDLLIVPVKLSLPKKLSLFVRMLVKYRAPLHLATRHFRKPHLSYCEREVLKLVSATPMSAAEIITCIEKGHGPITSIEDVLSAIYGDEYTTFANIGDEARLAANEMACLTAIANMYLRQIVTFERTDCM